uniref:Uncharacterized protein n=1 Tax=Steinernema glaseri TaxID=37863 RepID=A0A1I7YJ54_9BILA
MRVHHQSLNYLGLGNIKGKQTRTIPSTLLRTQVDDDISVQQKKTRILSTQEVGASSVILPNRTIPRGPEGSTFLSTLRTPMSYTSRVHLQSPNYLGLGNIKGKQMRTIPSTLLRTHGDNDISVQLKKIRILSTQEVGASSVILTNRTIPRGPEEVWGGGNTENLDKQNNITNARVGRSVQEQGGGDYTDENMAEEDQGLASEWLVSRDREEAQCNKPPPRLEINDDFRSLARK